MCPEYEYINLDVGSSGTGELSKALPKIERTARLVQESTGLLFRYIPNGRVPLAVPCFWQSSCGASGVAAVILDVVFDLGSKVLKTRSWGYIALMAAAFIANTVLHVNVVVVILAAAAFGVVRALAQWKKGGAK